MERHDPYTFTCNLHEPTDRTRQSKLEAYFACLGLIRLSLDILPRRISILCTGLNSIAPQAEVSLLLQYSSKRSHTAIIENSRVTWIPIQPRNNQYSAKLASPLRRLSIYYFHAAGKM